MGETRVNLGHLLEDLRDSYPFAQEEAIVIELIANALDSGAAVISFTTEAQAGALAIVDNGAGMGPKQLEQYHDIAATTKSRGRGIGFAGVGAKLALLIADEVATETKRGSHHKATRWRLDSPTHASWEYAPPPGLIRTGHGTAVAIQLRDPEGVLTKPQFISGVIRTHFYPLLDPHFVEVLRAIYKHGVSFSINGKPVRALADDIRVTPRPFLVQIGKRKNPVGIGFVGKAANDLPEEKAGIAVSTYGKVIKRGWDWIGLVPQNPMRITGLVEVPALSEILTLNKADFLRDSTSLQKYYRYRKAIQRAIEPVLRQMGELREPSRPTEKDLQPLQREIERVLANLVGQFPEISPLLDRRHRGDLVKGILSDPNAAAVGDLVGGVEVMTGTRGGGGEGQGLEIERPVQNDNFHREARGWLSERTLGASVPGGGLHDPDWGRAELPGKCQPKAQGRPAPDVARCRSHEPLPSPSRGHGLLSAAAKRHSRTPSRRFGSLHQKTALISKAFSQAIDG